jgi:hypothetical protein
MSLTSYQAAPPRGRLRKYAFGCEAQELFTYLIGLLRASITTDRMRESQLRSGSRRIHCSAMRVEGSVARNPLHPSAATTNAAFTGDLDDIPLGTPKQAPALFQTHFYKSSEQPAQTDNAHYRRPEAKFTHVCILLASSALKRRIPAPRCSSSNLDHPA